MPYLGMDLDAKKKIPLVANALGLHPGIVAWGLLNLWEYCWANGVEVVSELVLSGCVGDVRLPEVLEAYGFLERVPKGWTSEITTQPIPADAWRVRGAKKYLNLKAGNSKGGHAAKGNLIPGGPRRCRSAGAEGEPRGSPADGSARPRPSPSTQHPAPNTEDQSQHLAGTSGDPLPGKRREASGKREKPPADPRIRELSDRLVATYQRVTGRPYAFQGAKDGSALPRLVGMLSEALTVDALDRRFEAGLRSRFGTLTGIADFAGRPNDPRWAVPSTRAEDQQHSSIPGVYHG